MSRPVLSGGGLVTPWGAGLDATATAVRQGRSCRPDPTTGQIELDPAEVDDALGRAVSGVPGAGPALWRGTGLGVRAGLLAALEAARASGIMREEYFPDRRRVALLVAGHHFTGELAERTKDLHTRTPSHVPPSAAVRMWDTDLLGLLSRLLEIRGETGLIAGASASGLVAIAHAARLLATGEADACLVVAPALELRAWQRQALLAAGAMRPPESPPGGSARGPRCTSVPGGPFDESARGFVPAQLAGAVVLEHPAHARARGAEAMAEHLGAATRLAGVSGPEPDTSAQVAVVRAALAQAGTAPAEVDLISAHATGSPRGDSAELNMLKEVFAGEARSPVTGALKGLLGHGLTSAGLVAYLLTALQLREGFVHPQPGLSTPRAHPGVRLCTAGARTELKIGLTTAYGFGGIHAAAVLRATGSAQ